MRGHKRHNRPRTDVQGARRTKRKKERHALACLSFLVGVGGLEPPASWSRTKRATSCATPRQPFYYRRYRVRCQGKFPSVSSTFSAIFILTFRDFYLDFPRFLLVPSPGRGKRRVFTGNPVPRRPARRGGGCGGNPGTNRAYTAPLPFPTAADSGRDSGPAPSPCR